MSAIYDEDDDDIDLQEHLPSIKRLTRDLSDASMTMGAREARFLVDTYYTFQENRKRAANQIRSMAKYAEKTGEEEEPHVVLTWVFAQSKILEAQIKKSLDKYTEGHIMGSWMRQIVGIGPVISAGILANLEEPRPTVGKIYAFAGIAADGQKPWKAKEKRPYNQRLKTVCWHAGQSFMKLAAHTDKNGELDCFYGQIYRQRKAFEQRMSDEGKRAETAKEWLPRVKPSTDAYKHYAAGRLPPSQIDGRARRYAVKLFLSHMNEVWLTRLGRQVPAPFIIEHGSGGAGSRSGRHVDYIPPPIPA